MLKCLPSFPILLAASAPILAVPAEAGKSRDELTKSGYKCVRVATNFIECTKPGSTTYWCDNSGNCEAKPRRTRALDNSVAPGSELLKQ